jgi:hypothetical protein
MPQFIPPHVLLFLARTVAVLLLAAGTHAVGAAESTSWLSRLFGSVTEGSGMVATETRAVTGFQEIAVGGSMQVVLRQSGSEGVEVSADHNLLPLIETRVSDGTLHIGFKRNANHSSRNPVTVTVDLMAIKALSLGGSGSVTGANLKASKLSVTIGGSGGVTLTDVQLGALGVAMGGSGSFAASGRSAKLNISIGGSGGALTEQLDADDVSVAVGGSGGAVVKANRTLNASVAGSGDVVYTGGAVVKASKAGSGTIIKR